IPESVLGQRIAQWMKPGLNPDVGTRASPAGVSVRLVARAESREEASRLLAPIVDQMRELLKDGLYGEESVTLPEATFQALRSAQKTVALAESCTAGLTASKLGALAGVSEVLLGSAVVYSNEAKVSICQVSPETLSRHGAV